MSLYNHGAKRTIKEEQAAVSCSPDAYQLGGVGLGFWLTGKLGRVWVDSWVGARHDTAANSKQNALYIDLR